MVEQFLGLKLKVVGNALLRNPWRVVGTLLLIALAGVATVLAVRGLEYQLSQDAEGAQNLVVAGGALLTLAYAVLPLVFGSTDPMDPRKFAFFGIANGRLARGLALAGLIGVPGVVIVLAALLPLVLWRGQGVPSALAIVMIPVVLATATLLTRVTTTACELWFSSKRAKGLRALLGIIVVAAAVATAVWAAIVPWRTGGARVVAQIAEVAGWTPFGAAWATPGSATFDGRVAAVLLHVMTALFTVALLYLAWRALVGAAMKNVEPRTAVRQHRTLGIFALFPSTPLGVITARGLRSWFTDPRYYVSVIVAVAAPFIMLLPLLVIGSTVSGLLYWPLPVICLLLGWQAHNDAALDGTAIWMHLAAGGLGFVDRLGRAIPVLIIAVPLIALGSFATLAMAGSAEALPLLLGLSIGVLLVALGVSSFFSAQFPYPAPAPGGSPFAHPQASGGLSGMIQFLALLTVLVFSVPTLWAGIDALAKGSGYTSVLGIGLVNGIVVFALGIGAGAVAFNKRGALILAGAQQA